MLRRVLRPAAIALALLGATAPAGAAAVNPGIITLGDFQIAGAATQPGQPVANLQGMTALSCQVRFFYGSGGTKTNVYIQSSIDQGQSWFDIANIAFTTSSAAELVNLSGLGAVTTPTPPSNLALSDNTTLNGSMGDRLQAVVVSTGAYAGSTLASVRCAIR
jgi:hypothetical protein